MLEETPQIVHFSGYREGLEGLVFKDENGKASLVSEKALEGLFELFSNPAEFTDPVNCVVLNGCYSQIQAEAIAKHVPYVVGMTKTFEGHTAIEFAVGFYDALGAGRSVEFAYKVGCTAVQLSGNEQALPIMIDSTAPKAMLQRRQLANRTKEIEQFYRMVNRECFQRILLVEAPSGYGKTSLLMRFEAECPRTLKSAWVDLKAAKTGAPYLFSRIREKLGVRQLPNFDQMIEEFVDARLGIKNRGEKSQENQIKTILNIQDEDSRSFVLTELGKAFFTDLSNMPCSILIILDTFNAAPETLANWIAGGFLAEVADSENVLVILAGQKVPEPSGEWKRFHQHCRLDSILEVDAWQDYAQDIGLSFNRDEIRTAIRILKGQPSEIVKAFDVMAKDVEA
ncbi:ATP-binding protein [Phormidium sp. FACHB-77]|nr:ATP-binding protein [Phormidium sp. FACHB-77]